MSEARIHTGALGSCGRCVLLALVVSAIASGCDNDDVARIDATLDDTSSCVAKQFPFEPSLFSAVRTTSGALFRMQGESIERTRADAFYISLVDTKPGDSGVQCPSPDALQGTTMTLGPDECAEAYFRFAGSCEDSWANLHIIGNVTFDEVGYSRGERVEGTLTGVLSDVATVEVAGETHQIVTELGPVEGYFDFEVQVGPAFQPYGALPD